jgi:hypothetical protein
MQKIATSQLKKIVRDSRGVSRWALTGYDLERRLRKTNWNRKKPNTAIGKNAAKNNPRVSQRVAG